MVTGDEALPRRLNVLQVEGLLAFNWQKGEEETHGRSHRWIFWDRPGNGMHHFCPRFTEENPGTWQLAVAKWAGQYNPFVGSFFLSVRPPGRLAQRESTVGRACHKTIQFAVFTQPYTTNPPSPARL